MEASSRDRITVDLRGLRSALLERAKAAGQSPSEFVRQVIATDLGRCEPSDVVVPSVLNDHPGGARMRVCLRMSGQDAALLRACAKRAGVPPGEYVGTLISDASSAGTAATRGEQRAALIASTAELATLGRTLGHLSALLRRGSVPTQQQPRALLEALYVDVRRHLTLASTTLAGLGPRRCMPTGQVPPAN